LSFLREIEHLVIPKHLEAVWIGPLILKLFFAQQREYPAVRAGCLLDPAQK